MYGHGVAISFHDLFKRASGEKIQYADCMKQLGYFYSGAKSYLCSRIFAECFYMILEDMLENNITFTLPLGKMHAEIHMKKIDGERLSHWKKSGGFKKLDFLKSQFVAYRPFFFMHTNNRTREIPIYTTVDYANRLDEKVNNGGKYC